MFYVPGHFPDIDTAKIDRLRKKYDPTYGLIGAHVTVVFPVSASIGAKILRSISKRNWNAGVGLRYI